MRAPMSCSCLRPRPARDLGLFADEPGLTAAMVNHDGQATRWLHATTWRQMRAWEGGGTCDVGSHVSDLTDVVGQARPRRLVPM